MIVNNKVIENICLDDIGDIIKESIGCIFNQFGKSFDYDFEKYESK